MEVHDDERGEQDALKEMAEGEFKMDEKGKRIMEYCAANIPIKDFMNLLSQEVWAREVLKDVSSNNPFVRSRALSMWGQFAGWLGKGKQKGAVQHEVEFE